MFTNKKNNFQKKKYFMNLALIQAMRNLGNTGQNPSVGSIIVKKGCVIASGVTSIGGHPHSEKNAIDNSKQDLSNSDMYVTLEPCSHYGKTPPCVNIIYKKKIKKVFFSLLDPDERSYNKSKLILQKKGVSVNKNLLNNKVKTFYKSYLKYKKLKLPFVTCKFAVSKDFYSISKKKAWITNKFSRGRVHLMRSNHDCIISSINTILIDNPQLTCRIDGLEERSPVKIILDKKLKVRKNLKILNNSSQYPTIFFYHHLKPKKIKLLKKFNIRHYKIPLDQNHELDLKHVLLKIRQLGFSRVFLESGLKLTTSFLKKNLIDDFKLFQSNQKLRINGLGSFKPFYSTYLKNKKKIIENVNLDGDRLVSYKMK